MASPADKQEPPPYISYTSFFNFIKGLKETGVPARIDKSVMSKMSGSQQSAMLSACKWLGLVDMDGIPTSKLTTLVNADDSNYSRELKQVLDDSYNFLKNKTIDLTKATGSQLEEIFRGYGIVGSTVLKAMAFFISAAREAKIDMSPHIKTPKAPKSPGSGSRRSNRASHDDEEEEEEQDRDPTPPKPGMVKITIPLHDMADGAIYFPENMTADEWDYALKMAKLILENYRAPKKPG